jgi:hypothetical protein
MTTHTDLLEDLFKRSQFGFSGVDRLRFRADHRLEIAAIDAFERAGMICVEGTESYITLWAIAELSSNEAARFFATAERIYSSLAHRYNISPGAAVRILDLASELQLEFAVAFRHILLMAQCYLCCGGVSGPQTIDHPELALITPAESILQYSTFKECVLQIKSMRSHSVGPTSVSDLWNSLASPTYFHSPRLLTSPPDRLITALPEEQANLLNEVYSSINYKLLTLASMGLRALIDMVCVQQVGDIGSFRNKLAELCKQETISKRQLDILLTVVDVGNASAHRGFTPDESDTKTLLDVVEHLLSSVYVHPRGAAELAKKTPVRKSR